MLAVFEVVADAGRGDIKEFLLRGAVLLHRMERDARPE